jgi:Ca2+-binding RTX toxin-like protein
VSILNGTTTLGTATVNTGGTWNWAFLPGSSSTTRTLTAVASDVAGNKSGTTGTVQIGTSGASTLTSTAGNDLFYGGAGADTFSFLAGFGKDVVADFTTSGTAHDTINFHGISSLNTFANVLSHTVQVGSSSVISDGSGDTLTLANISRSGLSSTDFKFV